MLLVPETSKLSVMRASPRRRDCRPTAVSALPPPSVDELELVHALVARIRAEIVAHGGALPFARFMQLALYEPGLGYYSAGRTKFGAAGDFITAPELGDVFARCIARAIAPVLRETRGDLVELGAGGGAFAVDALRALAALDAMPSRYRIIETSADLRARQRARVQAELPEFASRVEWLDAPPDAPWRGVLFANEVLDALPVSVFAQHDDGVYERVVVDTRDDDPARAFAWAEAAADETLRAAVARLFDPVSVPTPYTSEVCTMLAPWLSSVTASLGNGLALFVDYGYPRREFYLPQRSSGTLLAHYRHRATADVLRWPGAMDLTASVDFTAVAEAGCAAGFELACYAPQASFLIACGLPEILEQTATAQEPARAKIMQQVRRLTLPGEMGERFQAIAFTRGLDVSSLPFTVADQRHRL
jgi:SAM-dependent MidA family methyltransferase